MKNKKRDSTIFFLTRLINKITVVEVGAGIFGYTSRNIGENLLAECKNLTYIRINPRKEYKTLKFLVEDGQLKDELIDENNKEMPIFLRKEIEFFQSIKNELIEFKAGANEAISLIHTQIRALINE